MTAAFVDDILSLVVLTAVLQFEIAQANKPIPVCTCSMPSQRSWKLPQQIWREKQKQWVTKHRGCRDHEQLEPIILPKLTRQLQDHETAAGPGRMWQRLRYVEASVASCASHPWPKERRYSKVPTATPSWYIAHVEATRLSHRSISDSSKYRLPHYCNPCVNVPRGPIAS